MKRLRSILAVLIISGFLLLYVEAHDSFALFRDDMSVKEAEELVNSQREKSRVELDEKQREKKKEEMRKAKDVLTSEERQVYPSVGIKEDVPSSELRKKIIIATLLLVAIIIAALGKFKK